MLFNSLTFVIFFACVLGIYWMLNRQQQNLFLLLASNLFYGWWDYRFLSLIWISTLIDYLVALRIAASQTPRARRGYLIVSLASNLGILATFKYANFFLDSLREATSVFGWELSVPMLSIVLPVGISFYTFQTLSYTIDVYRGEMKPTQSFLDFSLFVAYFPQLVAGPIERAAVLLPQISSDRTLTRGQLEEAAWLILSGYYLKLVLADNLEPFTSQVFTQPSEVAGLQVVLGVYAAAFQIYGDFAGYSRIARGVSKLLGIELMRNFYRPYFAHSPSQFWRRWHISLSTWLRDYLYISLGGNRGNSWQTYRNLLITMLLGGLWHGAAWHFIAWGAFHGLLLIVHRPLTGSTMGRWLESIPKWIRVVGFFHITCFGWLLFFVQDLSDLPLLLGRCVHYWQWNGSVELWTLVAFALPVVGMELLAEKNQADHSIHCLPRPVRLVVYSVVMMAIILCGVVDNDAFIYFRF
jgi:D-alanyl-lipoteichoic acid acyltransferase DltB (MBOAT superfamily)